MFKCPVLASAFGDRRIWFRDDRTIASDMTSDESEACVREALKQKNFSFVGLFLPWLRKHQSAFYEVAVSDTFKDAQENISAERFALAKERLIILAKLAKKDNDLENRLLGFLVENWKFFPEATDIVYPHLSDDGKKSVVSLVASINFSPDHKELMEEIKDAGLIDGIAGGFHFAWKDGTAFDFQPAHAELGMRLATLWALHEDDGHLQHALDIMKYVCAQAEPDENLIEIGNELVELVKHSPLPKIRKRLGEIEAAVKRFEMKKEMIRSASELEEKFGYSIRKEMDSGQCRLGRGSSKGMKPSELRSLSEVVVFAARAGEMGLIMDAITLVRKVPLRKFESSNEALAQDLYLLALDWLESDSDTAALKEAFGKDFRNQIARDIGEMVKDGMFWKARWLYDGAKDDQLLHELIQLIPEDQRAGLSDKPKIDAVLERLSRKAG